MAPPPRPPGLPAGKLIAGVLVVIVTGVAAVAVLLPSGAGSSRRCLEAMAAGPGGTCPETGLKHESRRVGDAEFLSCPDPKQHLPGNLHLERKGAGTWEPRQEFPPFTAPGPMGRGSTLVRSTPVPGVELRPPAWWRLALGPLIALVALAGGLYVAGAYVQLLRTRGVEAIDTWVLLAALAISLGIAGGLAFSFGASESIEFSRGSVSRRSFVLGVEKSEPASKPCRAVLAFRSGSGYEFHALTGPAGTLHLEPLFSVGPASLGVGSLLQKAIGAP